MQQLTTLCQAATHQLYAGVRRRSRPESSDDGARDRGAVSLEQVLWFVAAGISVAVIAAILWNQIRDTAETPVTPPQAP